jgi:rSAM/selenodomain-associated transferase 1
MARPLIILFARAPRLGCVKRRLAAGIGQIPALRFYRNSLRRIIRVLRHFDSVIAVTPDRAAIRPHPNQPNNNQGHGDLGARMHRAFRRFPRRPVILIGADIPDLGAAELRAAAKSLRHHDAVFGPAADGGYYLVGMARRRPTTPFAQVRWSTAHALADTKHNFRHLRIAQLRTLHDVDDAENLQNHHAVAHCGAPPNPVRLSTVAESVSHRKRSR